MGTLFGLLTIVAMAHAKWRVQLHGRTLDSETGEPVFCTLEAYDPQGNRVATGEVDAEGNFAFFVPSSKELEIKIAENGYRGTSVMLQPLRAGRKAAMIDIPLTRWK